MEELDRKLQEARRQAEREDQRAEKAERALRDAEVQRVDADRYEMCDRCGTVVLVPTTKSGTSCGPMDVVHDIN